MLKQACAQVLAYKDILNTYTLHFLLLGNSKDIDYKRHDGDSFGKVLETLWPRSSAGPAHP